MSLVASTAVTEKLDSCGIYLDANDSSIAVELEDGTINIFDMGGNHLHARPNSEGHHEDLRRNIFAVISNKLVIADRTTGVIKVEEAATGYVIFCGPVFTLRGAFRLTLGWLILCVKSCSFFTGYSSFLSLFRQSSNV